MVLRPKKLVRVTYSYLRSKFIPTPIFLRLIPTDKCNLKCKYCFQYNNNSYIMTKEEFDSYFKKALKLKTAIISFSGGEPMIWPHLCYAINKCSQNNIITEMSTNAILLTNKNLEKLGKAGLDMLDISVDSLTKTDQSHKNQLTKNGLADRLNMFRKKFKTHIRLNAVITKNNINDLEKLIDFVHKLGYPISLGFVVPPLIKKEKFEGKNILFKKSDFPILKKTIKMILDKKRRGYPIIDPCSYFEGIFGFIKGVNDWDCKFSKKYSGIIVAPNGRLRSCTKLMDYINYNFLDLNPDLIKDVRKKIMETIDKCNPHCYSNCAYAAYYYNQHRFEFLLQQLLPAIKQIFKN